MGNVSDLFQNLSDRGSSNSRSTYNELLLNPGGAVGSTETTSPALLSVVTASDSIAESPTPTASTTQVAPNVAPSTSATSPTGTFSGITAAVQSSSSPSAPITESSAGSTDTTAVLIQAIDNSPPFDGLLVSWHPFSTAEERANARAALRLGLVETIHTRAMQASGAGLIERVSLPPGLSAVHAIAALSNRPGVASAEQNWLLQTQAVSNDPAVTNGTLWGMYGESSSPANAFGSQTAEAWTRGFTGNASVYVGIIDEGYQYTHSDLTGNAGTNRGEIAANNIDDDGNGYIDDVNGWDFFSGDNSVYDGTGDDHGTHVAGTIGGQGGNGIGVAGVNWDVSLLSGKFLGPNGGSTANAIKAVDYFTDLKQRGTNIVATNNSWGGGGFSQLLYDAINRANNAGILFVAAAGNNSTSTISYPAGYDLPNVISVASLNSSGGLSSFSNFSSSWVDLGAPGESIYSTLPDNSYGTYSGTSMATPHVTGAIALMSASQPTATMAQLKTALLESVMPTASLAGKTLTGGRVDVNAAIDRLSQLVTPVDPNAPTYAVTGPTSVNEGSPLSLTINTTNVAAGTLLYWQMSGNGITTSDFGGLSLNGSLTTDATGTAVFQASVTADVTTEGNESMNFAVFSDPNRITRVASTTVILNDTSKSAGVLLWGSTASDAITGSGGPDRVAGVLASGTTASSMGAGQIDTLTGNADADIFLLGDIRGVFYDDRVAGNLGTNDYANIKDFVAGVDKLQVRSGTSYLYTVSASGLSLYWDRNGNGSLNSNGTNRDELVAILSGVSALTNADLIGA